MEDVACAIVAVDSGAPSSAVVPSAESATAAPRASTASPSLLVSVALGVELEAHEPSEEVWKM